MNAVVAAVAVIADIEPVPGARGGRVDLRCLDRWFAGWAWSGSDAEHLPIWIGQGRKY